VLGVKIFFVEVRAEFEPGFEVPRGFNDVHAGNDSAQAETKSNATSFTTEAQRLREKYFILFVTLRLTLPGPNSQIPQARNLGRPGPDALKQKQEQTLEPEVTPSQT
jgi:hypothetical protein